jgi:hypothetical protein
MGINPGAKPAIASAPVKHIRQIRRSSVSARRYFAKNVEKKRAYDKHIDAARQHLRRWLQAKARLTGT